MQAASQLAYNVSVVLNEKHFTKREGSLRITGRVVGRDSIREKHSQE